LTRIATSPRQRCARVVDVVATGGLSSACATPGPNYWRRGNDVSPVPAGQSAPGEVLSGVRDPYPRSGWRCQGVRRSQGRQRPSQAVVERSPGTADGHE
jgi:hypothetical protein